MLLTAILLIGYCVIGLVVANVVMDNAYLLFGWAVGKNKEYNEEALSPTAIYTSAIFFWPVMFTSTVLEWVFTGSVKSRYSK